MNIQFNQVVVYQIMVVVNHNLKITVLNAQLIKKNVIVVIVMHCRHMILEFAKNLIILVRQK